MSEIPTFDDSMFKSIFLKGSLSHFGLWTKDLAVFDLKFGFSISKSSPGTLSEVVRLGKGYMSNRNNLEYKTLWNKANKKYKKSYKKQQKHYKPIKPL